MTEHDKTRAGGPLPTFMAPDVCRVPPAMLSDWGVKLVLLDVDNTIAPYGVDALAPEVERWARELREYGIEPFILSNNRGKRPEIFARALGTGYVGRLRKPFAGAAVARLLAERGLSPREAAVVGDQVFTDGLCARIGGLHSVVVRPIKLSNPFLVFRYGLEYPFRLLYKVRKRKNG